MNTTICVYFDPRAALMNSAAHIILNLDGKTISRLPLSNIKKILHMLLDNDAPELGNVLTFDRFISDEAERNGLFDPERTAPLTTYEKKIGKILAYWDNEIKKRALLLFAA